jgi:8-oxo-dGTP diphosphatase
MNEANPTQPKITKLNYTYKRDDTDLWVLNTNDLPINKDLIKDQQIIHFAPKSFGGNHSHPRTEWFIGIGDLTLIWLDQNDKRQEQNMTSKGQVLLGKRKNAYRSGFYGLPGGRIDHDEKAIDASQRELLEETGLKAKKTRYVGVVKEWQDSYNFIHFIYECSKWEGNVELMEPEKCESWEWFDLDELPKDVLPGHLQAIKLFENDECIKDI